MRCTVCSNNLNNNTDYSETSNDIRCYNITELRIVSSNDKQIKKNVYYIML